jgi:hypothetical protein
MVVVDMFCVFTWAYWERVWDIRGSDTRSGCKSLSWSVTSVEIPYSGFSTADRCIPLRLIWWRLARSVASLDRPRHIGCLFTICGH